MIGETFPPGMNKVSWFRFPWQPSNICGSISQATHGGRASFQGRPPCCPALRGGSRCPAHRRSHQRVFVIRGGDMEDTRGTRLTSFQLAGRNMGAGRKESCGGRGQAANGLWIYAIDLSTHQLLVIALARTLQTWLYCANNFTHA